MVNLSSPVDYFARTDPERPALYYGEQTISYGALNSRIEKLGALIQSYGVSPGDRVAMLMKNSAAFIEIAYAVSHVGAAYVPINFRLATDEVAYVLDNSGAKLLFVDDEFADRAEGFGAVIAVGEAAQANGSCLAMGRERAARVARAPEDLMRLMYTSGTTNRPKGVMHSYGNVQWKNAAMIGALGLGADDHVLISGPLYHAGASELAGLVMLTLGGALCILRDFSTDAAFSAIARHRITGGWLAPVMLSSMLADPNCDRADLGSVRWIIGGGDRTPEPRIRAFAKTFVNARYVDAYGLTETCAGDTLMTEGREIEKIGSTGQAIAYVDLEIRDDAGRAVGPGVDGEICLRGPKISQGYWRNPEATRAAFTPCGWFRTGDVGHLDDDGFLFLTDRRKDLIISGGENIASSEVERVIDEMPEVSETAVIGLSDEKWGEVPAAVVVVHDGATLTLDRLVAHCRPQLAGFKVPKVLYLRDRLPRNASGKILKRALRDSYSERR